MGICLVVLMVNTEDAQKKYVTRVVCLEAFINSNINLGTL